MAALNENKSEADQIRREKKWREVKLCDSKFTNNYITTIKNQNSFLNYKMSSQVMQPMTKLINT